MLLALGICAATPVPPSFANAQTDREVSALLNGIPEHGNSLGRRRAPVTLVIFGDLQSPITGEFMREVFPKLVKRWVRSGRLRVTYRSFESVTRDRPEFERQQIAALAAGNQNKGWLFMNVFYREQVMEEVKGVREYVFGYASDAFLEEIATQTEGLDLAAWRVDRLKPKYRRQIAEDTRFGNRRHIAATPSFLIGDTGATLRPLEYEEFHELEAFNKAIKALLRH
jgi:protein-disulfide isomerase